MQHFFYKLANGNARKMIQISNDKFGVQSSSSGVYTFELEKSNNQLTITSVNQNTSNGGMFIWIDEENELIAIMLDEQLYDD